MLLRIDRVMVRVPNVPAAVKYYCDVMGLKLIKQQKGMAFLRFAQGEGEMVLHDDPDLPAGENYYLVDDVRELFEKRSELKLNFVQQPKAAVRGYRAAIRDPFGNVLIIVDRTSGSGDALEDGKPPGALFSGIEEKIEPKREELIRVYEQIGRTADDLPYTPDFEKLHAAYCAQHREKKPQRQETWRHLLNLRKAGKLPKLGEARSRAPEIEPEQKQTLRQLIGEDMGKRDRLPYTEKFDRIVDQFNKQRGSRNNLSPHLVWRLVATLAK
jgi:catechol 2,3-dioxygenase-like lactoylglutathione lyase family enzyme